MMERQSSLKVAVQTARGKLTQRQRQGLRDGRHAPLPAGAPPLLVRMRSKASQSAKDLASLGRSSKALLGGVVSNLSGEIMSGVQEAVSLRTELHEAARAGQLHEVALLISQGAYLEATDEDGLKPLHEAVRGGNAEVVRLLLERGAKVDAWDRHGQTPLHMAATQSFLDVVELLVKHGAELQAVNHDGRTSVDVATENNQSEIAVWLEGAIAAKGPGKKKDFKFYPFPSWLRWPTVPLYVCVCCLSGLVQSSFAGFSDCGRNFMTMVPLAIVMAVLVLMWTQLVVFHCRHRRAMWRSDKEQQQMQPDGDKRQDRPQWLLSAMRQRCGAFVKNASDMCEPERTERLLAKPLLFFPRRAADAYESLAVTVLFMCRGDAKHAMAYQMGKLSAQLAVVALASSGAAVAEGSLAASSLAITTLVIQIIVFTWIVCGRPSIDRMDRLVQAASWGADSAATASLLIQSSAESAGGVLATTALLFSLLGMALPMIKLVCDSLFVRLYRLLFVRATRGAGESEGAQAQGGPDSVECDPECGIWQVGTEEGVDARRSTANPDPDIFDSAAAPATLMPQREKPSLNRQVSLKAAIRTVQIAQHVERKHTQRRQGLLEGTHAPLPTGAPPLTKMSTTQFLSSLQAAPMAAVEAFAAALPTGAPPLSTMTATQFLSSLQPTVMAAAPAPAVRPRISLKAAARTVQTTVHMERKLTIQRQGLREGRHGLLPPGLPQGPPPTADSSLHQPELGRIAIRRVRQAQSFDRYLSETTLQRTTPRARVSDSGPIAARRVSSFPTSNEQPIMDKHQVAFERVEMQARRAEAEAEAKRSNYLNTL